MAVYVIASLTIKDAVRFEDYKRTVIDGEIRWAIRCPRRTDSRSRG
jgi:hypothetical protein